MRTFYLVRHAEKAWNNGRKPSNKQGHQHDPPIEGQGELATTIKDLDGVKFDHIFCSPFLRTRQTATIVLNALKIEEQPDIRKELGEYLGNHRRGIPDISPATREYYPNSVELKLLTSESILRLKLRVKKFLESLPPEGHFLIVSHGIILREICGVDVAEGALYVHKTE